MNEEVKILSKAKFNSLLKEVAKGNQAAFQTLYSASVGYVYSAAVSVVKSSYFAEEVVEDVFVKIWQTAFKLKNIENPLGWLYIVTSNCAKDRIKQEKHVVEIFDIPQEDKNIEKFLIKEAFLSYISPLSEEEQQIMILYYVKDLTFKSIAKEMNKPISTVSSIHYRALEKLGATIEKF